MSRPSRTILAVVFVFGVLTLAAGVVYGSGFEVQEFNARGLANANAGKSAVAEDAVTAFHNPAGLTRLKGFSGVLGFSILLVDVEIDHNGSTNYAGAPAVGDDGDDSHTTFIPAFYMAYEATDWLDIGLSVNAPYGLSTTYDDHWKGRYSALDTSLETLNVNPAIAVSPLPGLSVGVGVSWQHAEANLTNAVDFGTIGAGAQVPGLVPEMFDGEADIEGDDANWGWNFGILYEIDEGTRVGLAYRSQIHHTLDGEADFTVPAAAAPLTAGGMFTDTDVTARITLPEQISLSAYAEVDESWAILADITWTRWSRFQELRIDWKNPAQGADQVVKERWHDTFRYSLGAIYELDEKWTFRGGIAWDETPIKTTYRTARIPLSSRFWVALGVGYRVNEHLALDLAYAHIFMREGGVDETAATGQRLRADYSVTPDVLAFQLTIDL